MESFQGPTLKRLMELAGPRNNCTLGSHGHATRPTQSLKHIRPLSGMPSPEIQDITQQTKNNFKNHLLALPSALSLEHNDPARHQDTAVRRPSSTET